MTTDTMAARRRTTVASLEAAAAVAVIRLRAAEDLPPVAEALIAGGVTILEITLTTPGAIDAIRTMRDRGVGDLLVGAGSVLTAEQAEQAVLAGASFIVSPVTDLAVRDVAHTHGVPWLPGAYTANELLTAHRLGADIVKLFPADALGTKYLSAVLAPMPFLRLMPTGGVVPGNVGEWLRAGAVAVGLGSALVDPALVAAGDLASITARARTVRSAVEARNGGRA